MTAGIKLRLLGALLALAGPCLAAAAELRVAVSRGPVSLPLYVAEARGFFAAEGLAVKMLECASGRDCFQQTEEGGADLATSAELLVTLDHLKAGQAVLIAAISNSSQQIKLVARRSAGIAAPADLRGKRIGTVARTSAQYFLDNWLLFHDIAVGQVAVVPLAVNQLVQELASRRVDAVAIWEPVAGEAAARLGADRANLDAPRIYAQHFVLSMPRSQLAAREADVQRLLRALQKAEQFIAARPDDAAGVLAARLQLDRVAARATLAEHAYRLELTPMLLSTMDSQSRWAVREHVVEAARGTGSVARAIDAEPLRRAAPGAVTLPAREP
ncbi:MAG TPA: ABC transporter substrate-binding protein [Roseateles sp.]